MSPCARASVVGIEALAYYTVELACPQGGWSRLPQLAAHARQTSERLTREGTPVRFLRSVFVPEDETCFYVYKAGSLDAVREAARLAQLPEARVIEAVVIPKGD